MLQESTDDRVLGLRTLVANLAIVQHHSAAHVRMMATEYSRHVCEPPLDEAVIDETVTHFLLKETPAERVPEPPVIVDDDLPPPEVIAARGALEVDIEARFAEHKAGEVKAAAPMGRVIDFAALAMSAAPEFRWLVPGWLSAHPTLMSGRGGMGKSLAALQMAVALATGRQFIGRPVAPMRVVLWSCEEDLTELHRRLERICTYYEIGLAELGENLLIDCRHGLDSTLLTSEFGRPMWTGLTEYLREQVNDWAAQVWIGDNLAHMYACSENERHPVTLFTSWLSGLRPAWCPLLIGHVAKSGGSEYSGSTAWENAVQMRWYLGDRLPDEDKSIEDEDEPGRLRFLCKRKTNYDQKDYVRFTMTDGLLVPEVIESESTGLMAGLRAKKAEAVVLEGLSKLTEMGINTTDKGGQASLPRLIQQYHLAQGVSPKELSSAMRALMVDGRIKRGETGRDSYRRKREGLILA